MKKMTSTLLALSAFAAVLSTASAQTLSNGTSGGVFTDTSTWDGGVVPTASQSWTIQSGDTVTTSGNLSPGGNATATITGDYISSNNFTAQSGGVNLIVNGGDFTAARINTSTSADSTLRVTLSDGSITPTDRFYLTNGTATTTAINSYTQSGGEFIGNAKSFRLHGADADDIAQLTITGNAGTFGGASGMVLGTSATNATAINFNFGTAADAGALTTINVNGSLSFYDNPVTLDFTNITRPVSSTSYSTTLFDYGAFAGSFTAGNLTPLGLGVGESATLVKDDTNTLIRVDYTLAAIPEPSTFMLVGLLGAILLYRRKQ